MAHGHEMGARANIAQEYTFLTRYNGHPMEDSAIAVLNVWLLITLSPRASVYLPGVSRA